jgi:ubiquinone/menaquinone biosynthesis C-methylase UbiE
MNEELRIRRTRTFDEIAELYDRARRECPDHVFSDLFAQTGIEPSRADVLEIGCGTGTGDAAARTPWFPCAVC